MSRPISSRRWSGAIRRTRLGALSPAPNGFSLFELLLATAIISLLIGLSTLGVSGLRQSQTLTSSGNLVMALAQQGRQNSLAKNALTALVYATPPASSESPSGLFCLMELTPGSSDWAQITPWQILPQPVVVDTHESKSFLDGPKLSPPLPPTPFRGARTTTEGYQVFSPDGSLFTDPTGIPSAPPVLRLLAARERPANYYEIWLNTLTGIAKVQRP